MTVLPWISLAFSLVALAASGATVHYSRVARRNWAEVAQIRADRADRAAVRANRPAQLRSSECATWHAGQHRSPDCKAGSHPACSGDGWCDIDDQQVPCSCACHQPAAVA